MLLRRLGPATALIAAAAIAGCGSSSGKAAVGGTPTPSASAASSSAAPSASASATADAGPEHRISVVWDDPEATPDDGYIGQVADAQGTSAQAFTEDIMKKGGIDGVAEGFSDNFAFPVDLSVEIHSGDGSPFYDPQTKTVNLFYSFAILTADVLKSNTPKMSDEELGKEWTAVNDFVLIHELGHAFVDVFDLPITGREEDAVDGLATYFFTDEVPNGDEYAYDAATFFAELQDVQGEPDLTQYADEHSLSVQRFYDIACKVAGHSDKDMQIIANLGILPDSRLQRCPSEYKQNAHAWSTLLAPLFRPGKGPTSTG